MSDDKKFETSDFSTFFSKDTESNSNDFIWMLLFLFLIFGFSSNPNCNESYLKGKIEAYENVLKGFDDNGR